MQQIPRSLMPVTKNILERLREIPKGRALVILENAFSCGLSMFKSPGKIETYYGGYQLTTYGLGVGWYIKQAGERRGDLWGSFSDQLVMMELRNKNGERYGVKCDQAGCISSRGIPLESSYLLNLRDTRQIKHAFYFAAQELLRIGNCGDFSPKEIIRLADFLNCDFNTGKYSKKSQEIGLEADAVFFPAPKNN